MRKRFGLAWMLIILSLALMLPVTTAAASYGNITNTSTSCKNNGGRVNATFRLTKFSGFYATKLIMDAYGQGYYNGRWVNDYYIGRWYLNVNTSGSATMVQSFYYVDNQFGSSRINVIGKIKNGSTLIAKGKAHSGFCG